MPELFLRPSQISANGSSSGQILTSNGTVVYWANNAGGSGGAIEAIAYDTFTANGTQNTFTLSTNVSNQNNTLVSVNGLLMTPSQDYTISGTTLSLLFTPLANAEIEVKKFTIGSGGGGGGASVTVSDTPPESPTAGNLWWNSNTGYAFIYYNDGDSSQWVELNPRAISNTGGTAGASTDEIIALNLTLGLL